MQSATPCQLRRRYIRECHTFATPQKPRIPARSALRRVLTEPGRAGCSAAHCVLRKQHSRPAAAQWPLCLEGSDATNSELEMSYSV